MSYFQQFYSNFTPVIKSTQVFNYRSVSHASDQTTSKKLIENDKDLRKSFPKAYKKLKKLNELNIRNQTEQSKRSISKNKGKKPKDCFSQQYEEPMSGKLKCSLCVFSSDSIDSLWRHFSDMPSHKPQNLKKQTLKRMEKRGLLNHDLRI